MCVSPKKKNSGSSMWVMMDSNICWAVVLGSTRASSF